MRSFNFIPHNTKIDFVKKRFFFFAVTILISLGSIIAAFSGHMKFGIDFKGGFVVVIRTEQKADLTALRTKLSDLKMGEVILQEFGSPHDVMIRMERQPGDEKAQMEALDKIKQTLGTGVEYRQVETVGPKAGSELIKNGIFAIFWSLIGIMVYIWFRFEWQFAVCAILALLHDCIAVLGIYVLFGLEFNINAIVTILLTASYSINDTVVIFDRIRENLKKFRKMPIAELINKSINETLSRTILTSTTTLLSLIGLYYFGGEIIADLTFPMICGIAFGTYSSICLAALILLYLNVRAKDHGIETLDDVKAAKSK